jgi:uncharacterized protein (TIGR02996 family)
MEHLATARIALPDEEAVLEHLLAAWRALRARELAELIETMSRRFEPHVPRPSGKLEVFQAGWLVIARRRRPTDLPALLDTILDGTQRSGVAIVEAVAARSEALAGWPADPRFGRRVARLLAAGPFGALARGHQPFWRRMLQHVLDHDDPAGRDELVRIDLARVFRGWNDVAGRIAFAQPEIDRVAAELARRHPGGPPPLPRALVREVAALRTRLTSLPPVTSAMAARLGEAPVLSTRPSPAAPPRGRPTLGSARPALVRAASAVERGDDEAALDALLEAWRATRAARIGELVDAVSARIEPRLPAICDPASRASRAELQQAWLAVAAQRRARDVPRLFASITHTHHRATDALARLRALDGWPADPRIAAGVIATLQTIPFHTSSTRPFWKRMFAAAEDHGDARAADALDVTAHRIAKILNARYTDLTSTRAWFAAQMTATAGAIRARAARPLEPDERMLCDQIATLIEHAMDLAERLVVEIAARPDDERARQVYGDLLLERSDPRGELIALQLADRDPERQEQLLTTHLPAWLGPLAAIAWPDGTLYERGFPTQIVLASTNVAAIEQTIGHPIWATVRRLHLPRDVPLPSALLRHPVMRSLDHLTVTEPEQLAALLAWDVVPYRSLGIDCPLGRSEQQQLVRAASKLRALRALEPSWIAEPRAARWLLESPIAARLEALGFWGFSAPKPLASWLADAKRSLRLVFVEMAYRGGGGFSIARERGRFSVAKARIGRAPKTRHRRNVFGYRSVFEQLAALPTGALTRLVISGPAPTPAERAQLDNSRARFPRLVIETRYDAAP